MPQPGILDWISAILSGKDVPTPVEIKPLPKAEPVENRKEPIDENKSTESMARVIINTLSFSSDLKTLFLIDDKRSIPFDLDSENGILVGTIKGQITVATAIEPTQEIEEDNTGSASPSDGEVELAPAAVFPAQSPQRLKLDIDRNQYTSMFNRDNGILFIMGATEIELGLQDEKFNAEIFFYDLNSTVLNIRKTSTSLIQIVRLNKD